MTDFIQFRAKLNDPLFVIACSLQALRTAGIDDAHLEIASRAVEKIRREILPQGAIEFDGKDSSKEVGELVQKYLNKETGNVHT